MTRFQSLLVKVITFLGGIYFVLEFLLPDGAISTPEQYETATNAVNAIGASAILVGIISLFKAHGKRIANFDKKSIPSFALIFGIIIMLISSAFSWYEEARVSRETTEISNLISFAEHLSKDSDGKNSGSKNFGKGFNQFSWNQRVDLLVSNYSQALEKLSTREVFNVNKSDRVQFKDKQLKAEFDKSKEENNRLKELVLTNNFTQESINSWLESQRSFLITISGAYQSNYQNSKSYKIYNFLFEDIIGSLTTAMFSLLAFFMATAAFRAFRIRSFEAFLMVASGTIVILGQIPFGIYLSENLPAMRLWLLQTPSSAAFRAIKIGAEVAALLLIFRMWLSLDGEKK